MTVIREVMTEQLVTVEPLTSVAAAVTVMGMHRVGAVLVMEHARLEGIFTEGPPRRNEVSSWFEHDDVVQAAAEPCNAAALPEDSSA